MTAPATILQGREVRSRRIESVRALAALGVVQYHTFLLSILGRHPWASWERTVATWGISPVYIFFALSGYLIFRPFARRDYAGGGPVNLRSYALNRVVRLLPIYYIAVTLILAVNNAPFGAWWRFYTFSQSYSLVTIGRFDGPLWTLVVELQFYIVLPFLAYGLARLSRGVAWRSIAMLAVIGGASYAYHLYVFHRPSLFSPWETPANFVFIVSGMVIGIIETQWQAWRLDRLPSIATNSATWLLAGLAIWPLTGTYDLPVGFAALVASFLIVGSVILPLGESRLVGLLDWRPLATLGIATYSLYVWHWPLVQWLTKIGVLRFSFPLNAVIAWILCGAVALVSYRVIEAPFLDLRRRWAPTTAEAAATRG
jgi:peptidoglycan/LPS O-acetylase OafA/YrhL